MRMIQAPKNITLLQLSTLQWQRFAGRTGNRLIAALFLFAGWYGLYQGYGEKVKKIETIQSFRKEKDSLLQELKTGINADTSRDAGKAAFAKSGVLRSGLWNTRLPSFKVPVSTAIFNVGQSDVFTYYYLFASENFEMQLLKQTEINNPLRALSGHFDVTFWIVYLLPLFIMIFTFNALSQEQDDGNWKLIASQGINEKRWLQSRFLVVGAIALSLLLLIVLSGCCINAVVFKQTFTVSDILFMATSLVYLILWLCFFYFINSLRKPTAYNALVSGIAWIAICLVLPVAVSKAAQEAVPVDNTTISTYSRRPQNTRIESSTSFAAGIIKSFAAQDVLYKDADADSSKSDFILRTYHAWHWLLHKQRWPAVQRYFAGVEKRQQVTNWSAAINPASSTDGLLTALADNDAASYHSFIDQTERLHNGLQDAFYPALFMNNALTDANYKALPAFNYQRLKVPASIIVFYLMMAVWIVLLYERANRNCEALTD